MEAQATTVATLHNALSRSQVETLVEDLAVAEPEVNMTMTGKRRFGLLIATVAVAILVAYCIFAAGKSAQLVG